MKTRILILFFLLFLNACATPVVPELEGRKRTNSAWPLSVLSGGDTSVVSTETHTLQYYFVCQTKLVLTPEERSPQARWKVNFINFTKTRADLFDGDTTQVQGAAGIIYDEIGGWFLVVPVVERIAGDSGITPDGMIFVRRDLFKDKLGDGLVRCKYKHPNPTGEPSQDILFNSDMTLIGIPMADASRQRRTMDGPDRPK